jgi:hypothetical protein
MGTAIPYKVPMVKGEPEAVPSVPLVVLSEDVVAIAARVSAEAGRAESTTETTLAYAQTRFNLTER